MILTVNAYGPRSVLAEGSCNIWLTPHLLDAVVELWYQSAEAEAKSATFIKPGWQHPENPSLDPYRVPGYPFPSDAVYTVKFPRQTVNGVTYKATELGETFTLQRDLEFTMPVTEETPSPPPSPPGEPPAFREQLMEAWNNLTWWQKALIVTAPLGGILLIKGR